MGKKRKSAGPDLKTLKIQAEGQWKSILSEVGGIPTDVLDGRHHPCPKCGGTDRFRLVDEAAGAVLCNQCFSSKNGDGLAAIMWSKGLTLPAAAREVAAYLGIVGQEGGKERPKPDAHLEWREWNDTLVALWLRHKPPVTAEGVKAAGGRLARYRGRYTVMAFPVWGPALDADKPVGWALCNTTGGPLPRLSPTGIVEWIAKPKLTWGSSPGLVGDLERLRGAAVVWKMEGISDMLAWLSMAGAAPDHAAVTNGSGCQERAARWMAETIGNSGKRVVYVVHDADIPGQKGAVGWDEHGRHRPGWAEELARGAEECRNVVLPFPIAEVHGKDFRDWMIEGGTFEALRDLAGAGKSVSARDTEINEANDDPFRLARLNLERYAAATAGRTVKFWAGTWWVWKNNRYVPMHDEEIRAKIGQAVKAEFDRINRDEVERFRERKETGQVEEGGKMPVVKKVTPGMVGGVLGATKSLVCISGELDLNTWLPTRERRPYVSMANGILDVEAVMADADDGYLLPHSPDWFSCSHVPYEFSAKSVCPKWLEFLNRNLEGDRQTIAFLQEWVGYLLLPDTGEQRFLIFEGEGGNGKSVFCAGVEAILGEQNCSAVPLELFGDRFAKTATLGKLANICGDVGDIDAIAEGQIKAFTSGNRMFFDRKGLPPIECRATARLMIACNQAPRVKDRTQGVWRRVLLCPWTVEIPEDEQIKNMDKAAWWYEQDQVAGMFNWALIGLARLRAQGHFTLAARMKAAAAEYRLDSNPAAQFLGDYLVHDANTLLRCGHVYDKYRKWAIEAGYRPLAHTAFGKEVARKFRGVSVVRKGSRGSQQKFYVGLDYVDSAFAPEELSGAYPDDF